MEQERTRIVRLLRLAGDAQAIPAALGEPSPALWSRTTQEIVVDERGLPVERPEIWTSLTVWAAGARSDAGAWVERCASAKGVEDAFVADLAMLSSRGECDWGTETSSPPWGEPFGRTADGAVVVVTSVGGDLGGLRGALRFAAAVESTRRDAARAPGNLGAGILFELGSSGDGLTVTVWDSRAAMTRWAYRDEVHPAAVARTDTDWTLARSSFTRFAVDQMSGTWANVP